MKSRAILFAVAAAVVSSTSGCHFFHNCFPNLGWRFHQGCCAPACGPVCPPACPPCGPVVYRPPTVVPDCPGCPTGPTVPLPAAYPPGSVPPGGYPPIIGNPMPLPGQPGKSSDLHQPMQVPGKPSGSGNGTGN